MYQGEDGRWLLMGTVPAIKFIQSLYFLLPHPKVAAKTVNLGEPWDQVRLPQPARSLHENDLLQTLDWKSHRGELFLIFTHYYHFAQQTLDEDTILWSANDQL